MPAISIDPLAFVLGAATLLLTNAFAIFGAYVSIRVHMAKLQTAFEMSQVESGKNFERLEKDIDGLAANMRASKV